MSNIEVTHDLPSAGQWVNFQLNQIYMVFLGMLIYNYSIQDWPLQHNDGVVRLRDLPGVDTY